MRGDGALKAIQERHAAPQWAVAMQVQGAC
jgi:hypothetical protein